MNSSAHWIGHTDCTSCPVRRSALFSVLKPEQLVAMQDCFDDVRCASKQVLYHQGAKSEALYTVREGAVKLVRHGADGSARIVRIVKPGDLAGLEVLSGREHDASAIAVGPVRICRLPLASVEKLKASDPGVAGRLLEKAAEALSEAQLWLAELTAGSAPARVRVARLLLRLQAERGRSEVIRLASADIAAILGITVETASRVVAAFKREGILRPPAPGSAVMGADLDLLESEAETGEI
jgi:CRP-like cAMP-binding protein